ncbi:MAG TPA: hypothetical protein VFA59_23125, partial [Vicinamibacterales bacterium]|nr:hypothetical protein [Vicinamibacterales bacterium]
MRNLRSFAVVVCAVGAMAAGQLPRLPDALRNVPNRLPDLDRFLSAGPVLTTSGADAVGDLVDELPGSLARGRFNDMTALPRGPRGEFVLRPGRFSMTVESFCLQAGASAGTHGDGFMMAPLKGPWAPIFEGILRSADRVSAIKQESVQLLLWAILARTKLQDMPPEVQAAATAMLSPRDLLTVNGGALSLVPQRLLDLAEDRLPDGVRQAFEAESRVRQMLSDGISDYAEYESIAVPDAADARGSIEAGAWIRDRRGFFIRFTPNGYQRVRIEVVVPTTRVAPVVWFARPQAAAPLMLDVPATVAVPADAGGQRLGLTTRPGDQFTVPTDDDQEPDLTPLTPGEPIAPATTPGTSAGTPGTSAGSPGASAGAPGASAGSPGASAGAPGTSAGSPGTSAGSPTSARAIPTAVLEVPTTVSAGQSFVALGRKSSAIAPSQIVKYQWTVGANPPVTTADPQLPISAQPIGRL